MHGPLSPTSLSFRRHQVASAFRPLCMYRASCCRLTRCYQFFAFPLAVLNLFLMPLSTLQPAVSDASISSLASARSSVRHAHSRSGWCDEDFQHDVLSVFGAAVALQYFAGWESSSILIHAFASARVPCTNVSSDRINDVFHVGSACEGWRWNLFPTSAKWRCRCAFSSLSVRNLVSTVSMSVRVCQRASVFASVSECAPEFVPLLSVKENQEKKPVGVTHQSHF